MIRRMPTTVPWETQQEHKPLSGQHRGRVKKTRYHRCRTCGGLVRMPCIVCGVRNGTIKDVHGFS